MSRLDLNLARRPFTNDTLVWILLSVLAATALSLTVWNATLFFTARSQIRNLAQERAGLSTDLKQAERDEQRLIKDIEKQASDRGETAVFARSLIRTWSFSWTKLFNELEQIMPMGVKLVNIRPRVEEGIWVRLDGVARDLPSFWELQENIQEWPTFGNFYPDVVQPIKTTGGLARGELAVSLEMEYFPDARRRLGLPESDVARPEEAALAAGAVADRQPGPETAPEEGVDDTLALADGASPGSTAGPVAASPKEAAPASASTASPPGGPSGTPSAARGNRNDRGRRGRKRNQPPVRMGVENQNALPPGAPGMVQPDITGIAPLGQRGAAVQLPPVRVDPAGLVRDENGREIPPEELQKALGDIRPADQMPDPPDPENPDPGTVAGGQDPGAAQKKSKNGAGDGRNR